MKKLFFSSFFYPLSAPIQLEPEFYLQLIITKSNCGGCLLSGTEGIRRRWSSHTQTAPNSHYVTAVNAQLLWIYSMCSQRGKPLMYPFGFMSLLCDLLWNVSSGFLTSPMKNTFRCHGILKLMWKCDYRYHFYACHLIENWEIVICKYLLSHNDTVAKISQDSFIYLFIYFCYLRSSLLKKAYSLTRVEQQLT